MLLIVTVVQQAPEVALKVPFGRQHTLAPVPFLSAQVDPPWQSVGTEQPHFFVAPHVGPSLKPEHVVHIVKLAPHALLAVPRAHVVPLQQPPLQYWVAEHFVVQRCVVASHAMLAGQSV
jgi:hypothetical protein